MAFLLPAFWSAPQRNNRATVHSSKLDDPEYLPAGKSLDWIVPEYLRSRWKVFAATRFAGVPAERVVAAYLAKNAL